MKQIELVIQNETGLHARPAKVLVNLCKQFQASIKLQYGDKTANAKSMISILTLGAARGSQILVTADGADEAQALAEIEAAVRSGLGDAPHGQPAPEPVVAAAQGKDTTVKASTPAAREPGIAGALYGAAAAPGIAVGPVFVFQSTSVDVSSPELLNSAAHLELAEALDCARAQLNELYQSMVGRGLQSEAAIFEAHRELLDDPDLHETVKTHVSVGEPLPHAWKTSIDERGAALAALPDPLLAARADDLRDVGRRVLRLLLGVDETDRRLPDHPVVLVGRELSPSDTAGFDPQRVLGFAITGGGPTSHIAILARAMGLPAIVGADESILNLSAGTTVILDGSTGAIIADPAPERLAEAAAAQQRWLEKRRAAQASAVLPAVTRDGRHVDVTGNAGSPADARKAMQQSADGIGLLRTEFLFLDRQTAPSAEEQYRVYREIAEIMQGRPVIVRTLDIGGDKPVPYITLKPEMNPFLGERGIRMCLNRPELFEAQLRGILRAAPFGTLRIMFPMVSDIDELRQARALVEQLRAELGAPPVQIGIMIEVPSAALLAEHFAPEVDFFSIGTNDLTQYTLAVDRAHPALASRHDALHPAVLRLIDSTIQAAHRYGKRADLCGELGSDPLAVPVLVGLGIDELSVSVPAVPTVKAQVRALDFRAAQALARQALQCATAQQVRALVQQQ